MSRRINDDFKTGWSTFLYSLVRSQSLVVTFLNVYFNNRNYNSLFVCFITILSFRKCMFL